MQGLRPTGDRVLIERLDGDGREETLASGLVVPARDLSFRRGNTWRVPDTFRARVLAVGPKAVTGSQGELVEGAEVLVHTYDQDDPGAKISWLDLGGGRLIVGLEDIIGVVEVDAKPLPAILKDLWPKEATDYMPSPMFAIVPKPPESVEDLGFHRARIVSALDKTFRRPIPVPPEAVVHVPEDVAQVLCPKPPSPCSAEVEPGYPCMKPAGHEDNCAWWR